MKIVLLLLPLLTLPLCAQKAVKPVTEQQQTLKKIESIIIPVVDFNQISVAEAIEFLRMRSRELDRSDLSTGDGHGKKSDNIRPPKVERVHPLKPDDPRRKIIADLQLKNVTLAQVIQEICKQTQLDAYITHSIITFVHRGQAPTSEDGKAIPDLIPIYQHPKSNNKVK